MVTRPACHVGAKRLYVDCLILKNTMRFKRFLLPTAITTAALLLVVFAPNALAQKNFGLDAAAGGVIPTTGKITDIIANIIRVALGFVGTLFLLLMLYAGFLWMTAQGDSKKIDSAKQMITGAIIGIMIIASAYAITSFVLNAAVNTGAQNTPAGPVEACMPKSCTVNDDCVIPGDFCYTGTCRCANGSFIHPCHPQDIGSCMLVNP